MDSEPARPAPEVARRKKVRPSRTDRFVAQYAPAVHVELMQRWAAANDGPMPTAADAEKLARARVALLRDGLGDLADLSPKVLDLNQRSKKPGRRGWRRNARPRTKRDDGDGWYWDEDD